MLTDVRPAVGVDVVVSYAGQQGEMIVVFKIGISRRECVVFLQKQNRAGHLAGGYPLLEFVNGHQGESVFRNHQAFLMMSDKRS